MDLTVDGGYVYFADRDGGTIKKVRIDGGEVTTLADGLKGPIDVAVSRAMSISRSSGEED